MKKMNCRLQKGKTALLSDGKTALELTFSDDEVAVCVYTDFKAEPLVLRAAASDGDMLTLALYPYRLELYINDVLCDEEWEAGSLIHLKAIMRYPLRLLKANFREGSRGVV